MTFKMNSGLGKQILSLIREGDYAHPGEEEAIDLVFKDFEKNPSRRMLDVGCGLCGTAVYLEKHGYGKVSGIDLNPETIPIVKKKYPDFNIVNGDVNNVGELFKEKFDIIYLFNSFYAFPDHRKALESLKKVAHSGTELVIFDYANPGDYKAECLEIPNPLKLNEIEGFALDAGWSIAELSDVSENYVCWYKEFCVKIESRKDEIINLSSKEIYEYVLEQYSKILSLYEAGILKAVILKAFAIPKGILS